MCQMTPVSRRLRRERILSQASVCAGPVQCFKTLAHPSQDTLHSKQRGFCFTGEETRLRAVKGTAPGHVAGRWRAARSDSQCGSHSSDLSQALVAKPWEQILVGSPECTGFAGAVLVAAEGLYVHL